MLMNKLLSQLAVLMAMLLMMPAAMADSYRYMHVTIDTPWMIFIFLLIAVLFPFVLMAILYWHNAMRKNKEEAAKGEK